MEEISFGQRLAQLRKHRGMTQLELAQILGVTNQAVSKWESDMCCPDIMLLPELADAFGVSVDVLFGREAPMEFPIINTLPWQDDDTLRAVCFVGRHLAQYKTVRTASVELYYSGNVGSVASDFAVTCQDCTISGDIHAGTGITCENVGGSVNSSGWVRCGEVGGNVSAGDDITCGSIGGNVFAGGSIHCQSVVHGG